MLRKSLKLLVSKDAVIPILQGPSRGMKWIARSSVNSCWLGSYEFQKQKSIMKYLRPGMTAYDIGAHVGFYTLLFYNIVKPDGRVYAFEPLPENITMLKKHLTLNKMDNVVIEPVAVSNNNKEISFYKNTSTYKGNIVKKDAKSIDVVKFLSTTIDHYVYEEKNNPPDFVKMDIEGAELLALAGMIRVLQEKKPIIFLALHGEEVAKECCKILTRHQYTISDLEGRAIDINQTYVDEIIAV
jgi:FkbM family methyltransferase